MFRLFTIVLGHPLIQLRKYQNRQGSIWVIINGKGTEYTSGSSAVFSSNNRESKELQGHCVCGFGFTKGNPI